MENTVVTQKQNNATYDQKMETYNQQMATYNIAVANRDVVLKKITSDQHATGSYPIIFGQKDGQNYFNYDVNYDVTYHWDTDANKILVTDVKLNLVRHDPELRGGGFWDAIAVVAPDANVPTETGVFGEGANGKGDLDNTNGETLWDKIKSQVGNKLFGYTAQNNQTEEYTIKYNTDSFTPYYAEAQADGSWILLRTYCRLNEDADDSKAGQNEHYTTAKVYWGRLDAQVTTPSIPNVPEPPVEPTRETTTINYHYDKTF